VDLVDRQRVRHHDRLAVDVENAGIVLDAPDLDRAVGGLRVQKREARRQGRCTCGIQQCPAGYGHDVLLGLRGRPLQRRLRYFLTRSGSLPGLRSATAVVGGLIVDEKSRPIESPMLLSAGSCSAMPRMLSITWLIGVFCTASPLAGGRPGGP